jgi:hypothetical protein
MHCNLFSYWLFIWFILYYFKYVKSSPLLILIIAYIFTLGIIFYLIENKISKYNLIKNIIINGIIKLIPILLIIKIPIIITQDDINMTIYLLLIYILIMLFTKTNPYIYYKNSINSYLNNKNKTMLSYLYDKIYENIIK